MSVSRAPRRIGLLGGTFDPVHHGHLRSALEVAEELALDELRLLPLNVPALRDPPVASPAQRLAMLRLAVNEVPPLAVDDRELRRGGISYSIDTLRELRAETGERERLCLVLGDDAYASLDRWKEWQGLLDYAHIVVLARPGSTPALRPALGAWTAEHRAADAGAMLREHSHGRVLQLTLRQLDISSTHIRGLIAARRSPRFLLPDAVLELIHRNDIYGAVTGGAGETF